MSDYYFYIFSAIAILSAILTLFSSKHDFTRLMFTIFLFSVSGIISLLNGGYISFLLIITASLLYFYKFIKNYLHPGSENNTNQPVKIYNLLVISVFGAVIASLTSSNIWQGELFLKKDISLLNFKMLIGSYYYAILLVIFVSSFLIMLIYKPGIKKGSK